MNKYKKIKDLLDKNSDIFCKNDLVLGYTDIVKHRIRTTDDKPIAIPHRRIPSNQMEEVRAHIKQLLNQNIIRKSSSPYAAPVVIVRKHDQSIRLCVDYRQLNKKTIRDAYPLPRTEEALDTLHGTKYYTSLDLSQGYYQVATDERDIHKTAFRVGTGGLYEYLRMPMGLSNSAATFQKIMEACFNDKNFEILLIYLDDILIVSKTVEEQLERLEFVFQRLR
jgi:hypothetical protein